MLTVCGDSMMTLLCGGAAPAYMLAPWVDECRCQGASCLLILLCWFLFAGSCFLLFAFYCLLSVSVFFIMVEALRPVPPIRIGWMIGK